MKILLSPAKLIDVSSDVPTQRYSHFEFLEEAIRLNKELQKYTSNKLSELMGVSKNLANLNRERNLQWTTPFSLENSVQAIYMFKGDVYVGLDAGTIPENKIDFLQDTVRILSGLYGLLKPLDLVQPYRLEMGTRLKVARKKNLYEFWDAKITDYLTDQLDVNEPVINLASHEYFKAIKVKALNHPLITPVFKDYKNGTLKVINFFAKKARGLMTRYIIDNEIKTIEPLKGFDYGGYQFNSELSDDSTFVFVR